LKKFQKNCKTPLNKMSFSLHNQFQLGLSNDPSYLFTAARVFAERDVERAETNKRGPQLAKITNPSRKLSVIQGVGVMHSPFVSSSASLFAGAARNDDNDQADSNTRGTGNRGTLGTATTILATVPNTGINDSIKLGKAGDGETLFDRVVLPPSTPDYGSVYYAFLSPCVVNPENFEQPSLPEQVIEGATPPSDCPGDNDYQPFKSASLVSPVENEIFYNPDADGIISSDLKVTNFPKVFNSPPVGNYPSSTVSYEKRNAAGVILNYPAGNATIAIQLNVLTLTGDPTQAAEVEWIVAIAVSNTAAAPLGVGTTLTIPATDMAGLFPAAAPGIFIGDLIILLTEDNFANGTPFTDRDPKNLGKLKNISVLQPKIMNAAGQKAYTQQISRTNENIFQLPGDFEPRVVLPSN